MKKRLLSALLALSVLMGSMPVYALEDMPAADPAAAVQSVATGETAVTEEPEATEPPAADPQPEPTPEATAEPTPEPTPETTAEAPALAAAPKKAAASQGTQTQSISVPVDLSGLDMPDNDELFALYMQQQMYPDRVASTLANWGDESGVLTEVQNALYHSIKNFAMRAAEGSLQAGETAENISVEVNLSWTYEELGVDGQDDTELTNAWMSRLRDTLDVSKVLECVLADCPADLYWFDKTYSDEANGVGAMTYGVSITTTDTGVVIDQIVYSLVVAPDYRGTDGIYSFNTEKIQSARNALVNADLILAQYQNLPSAYDKMVAFKQKICDLTSYNFDALGEDVPYGDPWQLIYVFDQDPETTVVCEGYAKAFQYLCDKAGISCYTVIGDMNGGAHMWNVVPLDGQNYLVDVTNSDTGMVGQNGGLFLAGTDTGDWQTGYTLSAGGKDIVYTYDLNIQSLYTEDILTLAPVSYDPASVEFAITGQPETVSYADTFSLGVTTTGGSTVTWTSTGAVSVNENGQVTANDVGAFTVTATCGENTDTWSGTVEPRSIFPVVEVTGSYTYTGDPIEPTVTVRSDWPSDTLVEGKDYTLTFANNTNAGSTATVTVTALEGGHYTFINGPASKNFTIAKASAPALADQTVSHLGGTTGAQTFTLDNPMPTEPMGVFYKGGEAQDPAGIVSDWSVGTNGTVSYTLTGKGSGADTAKLPIRVQMMNYEDATLNLVITLTDRAVPAVSAKEYTQVYDGQPVPAEDIKTTAEVAGSWSWKDEAPQDVADSGSHTLVFTPDDTQAYAPAEVEVQVTITPADSRVTEAPQPVPGLTYTGKAQNLVTAGTAQGGTLQYALSADGDFAEELPTATDAGEYTVWYKVKGDANHGDTEPVALGPVAIAKVDAPVPTDTLETRYGHKLSDIGLPNGWQWVNPDTTLLEIGKKTFPAIHKGDNNYNENQAELTVLVQIASMEDCEIEVEGDNGLVYDGKEHPVTITRLYLEYNPSVTLIEGYDYTIESMPPIKDAGSYQLWIRGIGSLTGEFIYTFFVDPKTVEAEVTVAEKTYDGTDTAEVSATVETGVEGDTLTITGLKGTFAQTDAGQNLTVTVDSTDAAWNNTNYEVEFPGTATGSILPADYSYAGVAGQTVKIGNGLDTVNVVTTAAGVAGETVQGTVTWYPDDTYTQPLTADYRFSGQEGDVVTLYWAFTADPSETNYTAAPKTGSTNFTLSRKATPKVSAQGLTKTYDGKAVTWEDLNPTADVPGSWALDASTPELKNAGDYNVMLRFTPENAREYETVSLQVAVKVEPRLLTATVELSTNQITTQEALPSMQVVWSGMVEGEEKLIPDTAPTFEGLPEPLKAGYYSIHWANSQEILNALWANPLAQNYRLQIREYALLTVTEAALLPGSSDTYRLEADEGLTYVPNTLVEAGFPTEKAVLTEMFKYAAQRMSGATRENTALYNVVLYYSQDQGKTWQIATKENFPAEGITVTLPYPSGTNATDFDFVVTHMLTTGTPGAVETPAVTKAENGLRFTVHSLSPIAISWTQRTKAQEESGTTSGSSGGSNSTAAPAPTATPAPSGNTIYYTCPACGTHNWTATEEGYRCDNCGYLESLKQLSGYGNVKGVYEPKSGGNGGAASASAIAQTGDESNPALWGVLLAVSALALGGLVLYRRKRNR